MKRKQLVARLARTEPALSTNDLIPILSMFAFADDEVIAYNDQIAISSRCKTGSKFEGCIPGHTFLKLLNASNAAEVEFVPPKKADTEVLVTAASSKLQLPCKPIPEFDAVFRMPEGKKELELPIKTGDFLEAVSCCMRSVSIDTTVPDQLGVTLIVDGQKLLCFATDNATLSHAIVKLKKEPRFKRVILSGVFCRELLNLTNPDLPLRLEVHENEKPGYALLENAYTTLFGKLIDSDKPVPFVDTFERHLPKGSKFIALPTALEGIVDRACIIAEANVTPVRTKITVKGDIAKFETVSPHGRVDDVLKIEKHAEVEVAVDPKRLKNGIGSFDRMLVTKSCFIMAGEDSYYFVGA